MFNQGRRHAVGATAAPLLRHSRPGRILIAVKGDDAEHSIHNALVRTKLAFAFLVVFVAACAERAPTPLPTPSRTDPAATGGPSYPIAWEDASHLRLGRYSGILREGALIEIP